MGVELRVEGAARLVPETRGDQRAGRLPIAAAVDPRLDVTLQLPDGLLDGSVVGLEDPADPRPRAPGG